MILIGCCILIRTPPVYKTITWWTLKRYTQCPMRFGESWFQVCHLSVGWIIHEVYLVKFWGLSSNIFMLGVWKGKRFLTPHEVDVKFINHGLDHSWGRSSHYVHVGSLSRRVCFDHSMRFWIWLLTICLWMVESLIGPSSYNFHVGGVSRKCLTIYRRALMVGPHNTIVALPANPKKGYWNSRPDSQQ